MPTTVNSYDGEDGDYIEREFWDPIFKDPQNPPKLEIGARKMRRKRRFVRINEKDGISPF
jgi:hypothetical protein